MNNKPLQPSTKGSHCLASTAGGSSLVSLLDLGSLESRGSLLLLLSRRLLGGLAGGGGGSLLGGADLGLLVALGEDGGKVGANDAALVLDVLARALLGDLLGDSLLVNPAADNGPRDLAGVLALEEQRLGLARDEAARRSRGAE